MTADTVIRQARTEGRKTLTEAEAKVVLKEFQVPVVAEKVAGTEGEAVAAARGFGYPVVLKALGAHFTHKTEQGLVWLNLRSEAEVREAVKMIRAAAGEKLEGLLIQPMVRGRREFVAGLFQDGQFGSVVMFGLGGVLTEALQDVVFGLVPLDERQAMRMIEEIRGKRLLGAFRGEDAVDAEAITRTLVGLSQLAQTHPEIAEVDINPLLADARGEVTAVDALVMLRKEGEAPRAARVPVEPKAIAAFFYPRSVAFVGATATLGKWGHMLMSNVASGGFKGSIHLVNPRGGTIAGRTVYRTVTDIPEAVDLAVVTIPADRVREQIPLFRQKGIRRVLLITSGFSETGSDGRRLEEKLAQEAADAGILILGPNTMGICNPHHAFHCDGSHVRPRPGSAALVAQSGNLGVQLLAFAEKEGVGIRAFGGSGNEAMIAIEDYLACFEVDDLTRTVVLYIESVKDGRRFYELARRVGRKKPVVVLKGGRTEAGNRAAASHTGAMASDMRVFEAACRQAGVVSVDKSMDLLDLSATFTCLPLPRGSRVAIMTLGGGWGVVTSDLCMTYGLTIPTLSPDLIRLIDGLLPPYWSRSNPIDLVGEFDPKIPMIVGEALLKWEGCDALIHLGMLGRERLISRMIASVRDADGTVDMALLDAVPGEIRTFEAAYKEHTVRLMETYGKPVLGVSLLPEDGGRIVNDVAGSAYQAVCFDAPERAVKALAKMTAYRHWLSQETDT